MARTVERDREIARIREALAAAREGRGGLLLIQGSAGVGKSHLLAVAQETAEEVGIATLAAAGGPLSKKISFGLASELVELLNQDVAVTTAEQLQAGEGQAAQITLHLAKACRNAAKEQPLLLCVDDLHWADGPSLEMFAELARTLHDRSLVLACTYRTGELPTNQAAVDRILASSSTQKISLAPFGVAGAAELMADTGYTDVSDEAVLRCVELTGGNPLMIDRLSVLFEERGEGFTPAALESIAAEDAIDVAAAVLTQIRGLGAARELAEAAAVLGDNALWSQLQAAADVGDEIGAASDRLLESKIINCFEPLEFAHPLVREALYWSQSDATRARRHRIAAEILEAHGADPEVVAMHLIHTRSEHSQLVIDRLVKAARQALGRGVAESAITYLERAQCESPAPGDERAEIMMLLGTALRWQGSDRAYQTLKAARIETQSPQLMASIDLEIGRIEYASGNYSRAESVLNRGIELLGEAGSAADGADATGIGEELQATYLAAARYSGSMGSNPGARQRLAELIENDVPVTSRSQRALLAEVAAELGVRGEPREIVLTLAQRAWSDGELLLSADHDGVTISQIAAVMVWSDAYGDAKEMLHAAIEHAAAANATAAIATARYMRGWAELYSGNLGAAVTDAQAAIDAQEWGMYAPSAAALLAQARTELNDIPAAATATELPGGDSPWEGSIPFALTLEARGRLAALEGDYERALGIFEACGKICSAMSDHHPFAQWRVRAALCQLELRRSAQATQLVEEEIAVARRAGAPRPLGMALVGKGRILEGEPGLAAIEEGIDKLGEAPAPIEIARAHLELGAKLRRLDRPTDAREPLRTALSLADRHSARLVAIRAAAELSAAGVRPRRTAISGVASLTPAETRTAQLAALGLTNREVAKELVVTEKTVQFHLSNVYKKLGISSRNDLGQALTSALD